MTLVLFEDEFVQQLSPVTLGRPAFAISCGGYRLIELAAELDERIEILVRPHLRAIAAADYPQLRGGTRADSESVLWVNARLVPSIGAIALLRSLLQLRRSGIVMHGGAMSAALVPEDASQSLGSDALPTSESFVRLGLPVVEVELPLLEYPHDIIRQHSATLAANLEHRVARGDYRQLADGVFAAADAELGQYVATDARRGPIVLDEGANVGPHSLLQGPLYVGRSARIIEHTAIKDGVSIGQSSKVGGEVEASIIEPYTNKQHHGFLGHSYLGSWINLGAGTANSDLKNSYGMVNMEYGGEKVPTDMQFLGTIIGDYAKTAINTSIFTGKTIGACSLVYGFATTNVPSFVNYARTFGQVTEASVDALVLTQRRMFERRGIPQRPEDVQLLRDIYELTKPERQAWDDGISRGPLTL